MAHEIDFSNDRANVAFTGSRTAIWHGLGSELEVGASIEVWKEQAGMTWLAQGSEIYFQTPGTDRAFDIAKFPKRQVLYRSDTHEPLSIVGDDFKIVQPGEVLEFFRDLTEEHGMVLSTAGCLFGGKRFWALAETDHNTSIKGNDPVKGFLLFMTAIDGSLASTAKFVSTRVVCNNTLTIALNEHGKNVVKKTHRSVWDNNQAKIDLGLLSESWETFVEKLNLLSNRKMSDKEVNAFFKEVEFDPKKEVEEQTWGATKKVNSLWDLYLNGAGAELSYGNAFGALNAITNYYTHGTGKRNLDRQFQQGYIDNDKVKSLSMEKLLEMC